MIGPRTYMAAWLLAVGAMCTAAGLAIHGLPGPDWMNWKGWGWILSPVNVAIGACWAWSLRGSHERYRRLREELERRRNPTPGP